MDAAQTRRIAVGGWEESNPILGRHQTVGQVNTYFALATLTTLACVAGPRITEGTWSTGTEGAARCGCQTVQATMS